MIFTKGARANVGIALESLEFLLQIGGNGGRKVAGVWEDFSARFIICLFNIHLIIDE